MLDGYFLASMQHKVGNKSFEGGCEEAVIHLDGTWRTTYGRHSDPVIPRHVDYLDELLSSMNGECSHKLQDRGLKTKHVWVLPLSQQLCSYVSELFILWILIVNTPCVLACVTCN